MVPMSPSRWEKEIKYDLCNVAYFFAFFPPSSGRRTKVNTKYTFCNSHSRAMTRSWFHFILDWDAYFFCVINSSIFFTIIVSVSFSHTIPRWRIPDIVTRLCRGTICPDGRATQANSICLDLSMYKTYPNRWETAMSCENRGAEKILVNKLICRWCVFVCGCMCVCEWVCGCEGVSVCVCLFVCVDECVIPKQLHGLKISVYFVRTSLFGV